MNKHLITEENIKVPGGEVLIVHDVELGRTIISLVKTLMKTLATYISWPSNLSILAECLVKGDSCNFRGCDGPS